MGKPLVDIVVLHWNQPRLLFEFMDHILDVPAGVPYRLIHVDNGSTENVGKGLQWYKANTRWWNPLRKKSAATFTAFRNPTNLGFSGGCNVGARLGNSPWLLFLNNDAFPESPCWLGSLVAHAETLGAFAIGPVSDNVIGLQQARLSEFGWPPLHMTKFLSGMCLLVRRDVFENLGGFDERFFNGDEDLDISIRLRQAGGVLAIDRSVFVRHLGMASLSQLATQEGMAEPWRWYERTRRQLHEKWGDGPINDLFAWEELKTPVDRWRKIGVLPNGFRFQRPGLAGDQLGDVAELSARLPRAVQTFGACQSELRPRTHARTLDDDTTLQWFDRHPKWTGGKPCDCDFCRCRAERDQLDGLAYDAGDSRNALVLLDKADACGKRIRAEADAGRLGDGGEAGPGLDLGRTEAEGAVAPS